MKKFYTMLLASAVAISAVAASGESSDGLRYSAHQRVKKENQGSKPEDFPMLQSINQDRKMIRGLRKADAEPTLEGAWTLLMGDFYFQNSSGEVENAGYLVELKGDSVFFNPTRPETFYSFKGTFDSSTNELIFTPQIWGTYRDEYIIWQLPYYYEPKPVDDIVEMEALVGTYDPENATITFPQDQGIAWGEEVASDPNGEKGYIAIYDILLGYELNLNAALEGTWVSIGMGEMLDPWVVTAMPLTMQKSYAVEIEQNQEIPTRYRLVNPYWYDSPAKPYNYYYYNHQGQDVDGYIVFDMADKKHIVFLPSEAGFASPTLADGITQFYCYNRLGSIMASQPEGTLVDEIVALVDGMIPFTIYQESDNTVYLDYKNMGAGQRSYDANFGTQNDPFGGNQWDNVNMSGWIRFPEGYNAGVNEVTIDDNENAPVEFFNLQGQRVAAPEGGQIVVRRQGSSVSKIVVR